MSNTSTAYSFDTHGHFKTAEMVMDDPISGELLLPDDCVTFAPDADKLKDNWAVLNKKKTEWEYTAEPTKAEECLGIVVDHNDQCPWACEMRALMQIFVDADNEHYKIVRGDNLSWTVEKIPEKTFEELKAEKLADLSSKSSAYQSYNCKEMYITSSLGFQVNADQCSQKNLEVLIALLPDDTTTTTYKIYDNSFKELNRVQLKTLLAECEQNGLSLYQQKFTLQAKVNACTTKEELDAVEIVFTMMDFSK